MNLVLLVQVGDDGPVKMIRATDKPRSIERAVARIQEGSPEWVHVRCVLDGDERLEAVLHMAFMEHCGQRDWYAPVVLGMVPADTPRYDGFDDEDERRRLAVLQMGDLR